MTPNGSKNGLNRPDVIITEKSLDKTQILIYSICHVDITIFGAFGVIVMVDGSNV